MLCFVMLMRSKGKRRANLPLRGGKRTKFVGSRKATENFVRRFPVERRRRQKGCISTGAAWFACFPFAPKARFYGFIIRGALPYFWAPTTAAKQLIKFAALAATITSPLWYCAPPFHSHIGRATKGKRLYFLVSP